MSDYHRFVPPRGKARYFGLTHAQVLEIAAATSLGGLESSA